MSEVVPVTVRLPEDLDEEIESRLDYGDSKSEWVRDAVREKLDRETSEHDDSSREQPIK